MLDLEIIFKRVKGGGSKKMFVKVGALHGLVQLNQDY